MGNYVACAVTAKSAKAAAVIFPGGEVRQVELTATAAELMVELPGHFVVCAKETSRGRKMSPLSADEELEPGEVYVMMPMQPVTAAAEDGNAVGPVFLRRLSVCRSKRPSLETIAEEAVARSR